MHSSRMRTVRFSGCLGEGSAGGGVCLGGVCLGVVYRIVDTRLWKHYLSATTVADGNNDRRRMNMRYRFPCHIQCRRHRTWIRRIPRRCRVSVASPCSISRNEYTETRRHHTRVRPHRESKPHPQFQSTVEAGTVLEIKHLKRLNTLF